jgi:hypothetical protein
VGPIQRPSECVGVQAAWRSGCWPRPRRRCCLLKGCERPFVPSYPQARYCSAECRAGAQRWRRWRACRTYRGSDRGQTRRREQSRRYRERLRGRRAEAQTEPSAEAATELGEPREGQRPAQEVGESCCARPGCYELFVRLARSPLQKCCGWLCRRALRRVREREARWRHRLTASGDPPPSSRACPFG